VSRGGGIEGGSKPLGLPKVVGPQTNNSSSFACCITHQTDLDTKKVDDAITAMSVLSVFMVVGDCWDIDAAAVSRAKTASTALLQRASWGRRSTEGTPAFSSQVV